MPAKIQWNPALDALPFSPIRQMFNKAATMQDVQHLSIGQPDFAAPEHVVEAHVKALRDGKTRYELDAGLPQLRQAIARFYSEHHGIALTEENVLITTGCCQAMYMAMSGVARPGKKVIIVEPAFVLASIFALAGAEPVRVVTTAEDGYHLDTQQVIERMDEDVCAVLLNSPGNPTGTVYPRETIEAICRAAAQRNIAIVSDEVYDRLILDDETEYASALKHAPTLDNVIMTSSVSKTYALAGLRLGWAISSKENIQTLQRYHMYISTTENTPTQWAVLAAFEGDQSPVDDMVAEYRRRRDRVVELLEEAPHLRAYKPGGAFFVMPSLPTGVDGFDVGMRMLDEAGVCVVPGGAFGASCNNALRISYATSMDVIEAAFERMIPWLSRQSF